jgi:DNA polymerase-3 subunit epsilon
MKTFFIDCETTGTDPKKHSLIQIAGTIFNGSELVDEINYTLRPFPGDEIEPRALEVNGRTAEEIQTFPKAKDVHDQFTEKVLARHVDRYNKADKLHFIGYNSDFDAEFVRAWFRKSGDNYFGSWFWYPIIDVAKLAGIRLMQTRASLPDFKLMTVAKHLGVRTDDGDAHDAAFDIKVTMRMFNKLTKDLGLFEFGATLE